MIQCIKSNVNYMPAIKNSLKENFSIYLAISLFSLIPGSQLIFIDNYNQLLIYDNLSFESVYFYLSIFKTLFL